MRITVPLTGEFLTGESGNPNNPVHPINLVKLLLDEGYPVELTDFGWELMSLNYENGTAELEVNFEKKSTTRLDVSGKPMLRCPNNHQWVSPVENHELSAFTDECLTCGEHGSRVIDEETTGQLNARKAQSEAALHGLLTAYTKKQLHQKTGEPELKKPFGG